MFTSARSIALAAIVEWYGKGNVRLLVDRMARLLHDPVGCVNGHSPAPRISWACCAYASGYGKSALWQANPSMGSSATARCAFSQAAALIKVWHLRARYYVYWSGVKENRRHH
jgi:hypothetical protein